MDSLLKKIKSGVLWDFPGGVRPPSRKESSQGQAISSIKLAELFYIPIKQHIGSTDSICVQVGEHVKKGQVLTQAQSTMDLPVHASTSGKVIDITEHVSAHPSGIKEPCIVLEADGKDEWLELNPKPHYHTLTKTHIIDLIKEAGIAGLGGAGFPSHVKHQIKNSTELLIINGVECEPYITADDMLMREYADEIIHGIEILAFLLEPKLVVIAIEDNKPEAIRAIELAAKNKTNYLVRAIPTKYPAGGEKQLIQVLTSIEIPKHKHPIDFNMVSHNIGTAHAIYKAIFLGEPLIERVVTVVGNHITKPGNYWVRLGTPTQHLINETTDDQPNEVDRIIMGGPMMGFTIHDKNVPIIKITNCILAPDEYELPPAPPEQACIRCSDCADACPANLLPQQLYWHSRAKEHDKAKAENLFDCIECGACAFVCPSDIPLVQYYRQSKAEIRQIEAEQYQAAKAKERFEARAQRLERDKQARLDKHKKAADSRKQALEKDPAAQDKIAAALARVKAKKEGNATPATDSNETTSAASSKTKAQEAIERAKAKRLARDKDSSSPVKSIETQDTTSENNEIDEVRSRLQNALKQHSDEASGNTKESHNSGSPDPIKSKAQAAIARAKAKKQAKQNQQTELAATKNTHVDETQAPDDETVKDPIKSKAQAAIARAKAKKLAKQQATEETSNTTPAAEDNTSDVNENTEVQTTDSKAESKTRTEDNSSAAILDLNKTEQDTNDADDDIGDNTTETTKSGTKKEKSGEVKTKAKAAIERAKARRIAKLENRDNTTKESQENSSVPDIAASDKEIEQKVDKESDLDKKVDKESDLDKKAKARAAIERAKARRNDFKSSDDKAKTKMTHQERVNAAIAKARAKREQN